MKKLADVVWRVKHTGRWALTLMVGIVVIVVGYGYYVFVTQVSGRAVVEERIDTEYYKVQLQIRRYNLYGSLFENYRPPETQSLFTSFAEELVDDDVRRIVIYNHDQTVVWSSEKNRLGTSDGADRSEIDRALRGEVVVVRPFGNRPFIFPRADSPADIFIPIHADDGYTMGVVVVSTDFSDVVSFSASIAVVTMIFVSIITALIWMFLHMGLHRQKDTLLQEEGKIASVLEQMPMGIAAIHKDGQIRVWNATMVALSGLEDSNEVIGRNAFDLPLFKLLGLDASIRAGMAGKPFEDDTRVTSMGHGQETWCHWKGVPIFASSGKRVEYLLLMVNDITEKKRKI